MSISDLFETVCRWVTPLIQLLMALQQLTWFFGYMILILPIFLISSTVYSENVMDLNKWWWLFVTFHNIITLLLFLDDRKRTINREFRTPDSTLLLFSAFSGSVGAVSVMVCCRHRTKERLFVALTLLSVVMNYIWFEHCVWSIMLYCFKVKRPVS